VKTRTESNGTLLGVNLAISESLVEVGGDDDIDGLNDTGKVLEEILLGQLKLKKRTVDLVDDDNRLNTLTEGLTKDSLGLHTDTFDRVNDNKGTVGDTESGSNLGREVNVTRRVNQVDQEKGDGGRLDGDTSFLLIRTCVCETSGTGVLG
jgi:hypothetical protein